MRVVRTLLGIIRAVLAAAAIAGPVSDGHALGEWKAPADAAGTGPGRFLRLHWFEHGTEAGNPSSAHNKRFRVNAPEVTIHPTFAARDEARGSGLLQILAEEDLRLLAGAELYCELWGGHPGTANRRVTLNGRTTYPIPSPGGDKQCSHLYPTVGLKVTDLVNGYNAVQFACDQGTTFWGHFIVDQACLHAELKPDHPDLTKAGLAGARATVRAAPANDKEAIELALDAPADWLARVARVDFQARYRGYDENGSGQADGWHGFTTKRIPVAWAGSAEKGPFAVAWDVSMIPAQENMAARAMVHFKDHPDLVYVTTATTGLKTPTRPSADVRLSYSNDLPEPFWSRAGKKKVCTIELGANSSLIERAELCVLIWDGGAGAVKDYFTLNGHPLAVARTGKHDVIWSRLDLDPRLLKKGTNRIEVISDTEYHGLEVLKPGPALVVRVKRQAPTLSPNGGS